MATDVMSLTETKVTNKDTISSRKVWLKLSPPVETKRKILHMICRHSGVGDRGGEGKKNKTSKR